MRLLMGLLLFSLAAFARRDDGPATSWTWQEAISFMKSADAARVFTVAPDGRRGSIRELDRSAREAFIVFISAPDNFGHPLGFPILPPEVGIEFQKGAKKFAVYTTWEFYYFYDHFDKQPGSNQMNFLAILDGKSCKLAQAWQQRYFPAPRYTPDSNQRNQGQAGG